MAGTWFDFVRKLMYRKGPMETSQLPAMLLCFEVGPSKKLGVEYSNQAASSENVLSRAAAGQLALDFVRPSALGD